MDDGRSRSLETRLERVEIKVDEIDRKIIVLDASVTTLDSKVIALDAKVTALDGKVTNLQGAVVALGTRLTAEVDRLDSRIDVQIEFVRDDIRKLAEGQLAFEERMNRRFDQFARDHWQQMAVLNSILGNHERRISGLESSGERS
jgi:chromosome segregation ATPase